MAPPSTVPPGTLIAGKYEVEGVLGHGGMGAVYQATNMAIGRRVAIKVLHASLVDRNDVRRRFELEARAAAVIGHPGIVDIFDMGETEEGDPFIVMEHLEGLTLRALNKELKGLTPGQAVGVMLPVLDALGAAHAVGIIHRDVKPGNVFVCGKPEVVKLLDFGVSRFGKSTGITLDGNAIGTPRYMSPEQVLGEADLGPEADLYSVGAVLYTVLGGTPPHGTGSDVAVLARVMTQDVAPLGSLGKDLPPTLCELVDGLLVRDRAKRPRDAAQVKAQLEALGLDFDLRAVFETAAQSAKSSSIAHTPSSSQWSLKQVARRAPRSAPPEPAVADDLPTRSSPEVPQPRPSRPSRQPGPAEAAAAPGRSFAGLALAVGIGVVSLVGGGTAAYLLRPRPEPAPAPAPAPVEAPAPAPAPEPSAVRVTLEAEPQHARFSTGDGQVDCNPCNLEGEKGSRQQLRVSAEGAVSQVVEVRFDEPHLERVVLTPLEAAPAKPPPPTKPARGTATKKKGKKDTFSVDEKNPYE